MYARRTCSFFPEQECDLECGLVVVVHVSRNLTQLPRKFSSVHMRVFELVAHCNVDNAHNH